MSFWQKLLKDESAINWAIAAASLAMSLIAWLRNPGDTVGIHWFLIICLSAFVLIVKLLFFSYTLSRENDKLSEEVESSKVEWRPKVVGYEETPFRILAKKSPLFCKGLTVTFTILGRGHSENETVLCHGKVGYVQLESPIMQIILMNLTKERRSSILELLKDERNYSSIKIYPGEISEDEYE